MLERTGNRNTVMVRMWCAYVAVSGVSVQIKVGVSSTLERGHDGGACVRAVVDHYVKAEVWVVSGWCEWFEKDWRMRSQGW